MPRAVITARITALPICPLRVCASLTPALCASAFASALFGFSLRAARLSVNSENAPIIILRFWKDCVLNIVMALTIWLGFRWMAFRCIVPYSGWLVSRISSYFLPTA